MKILVTFIGLLFCCACGSKNESTVVAISADSVIVSSDSSSIPTDTIATASPDTQAQIQVIVFKNDVATNGYGYDIMVNGKKMIHQPTIPAISGNHGFHSESDASNAGALVKRKLLNNEMPPTISIDELNSLGIH
jgi:Domain of unknown function (DUF4907)